MMEAVIRGVGILAPGMPDWERARPVLRGDCPCPDESLGRVTAAGLPRAEARRATRTTHLGLVVADQALGGEVPDEAMPSVWASADSDLQGLEKDVATLAEEPPWISPQRFQNSVHNTPSGYWSIVSGCRGPATALSSGEETFAAGLVEALVTLQERHAHCLLVVCDELSPPSLTEARPVPASFAAALLLAHKDQAGTPIRAGWQPCRDAAVSGCRGERLESMRRSNPAARSLPLLGAIASEGDRELRLSWCEGELALRCGATKGG